MMAELLGLIRTRWRALPTAVWVLGLVSLLMDTSSELVYCLLPAFLVNVVGATTVAVGLIEGIAEATAAIGKGFSGAASDWIGNRKWLVVIGYGLSAATKPAFPLAATVGEVLAARFIDRIGKGVRDAPRDALIADITPESVTGAAYGVRQALDTVGAFAGPLLAMLLMVLYANDFRSVFWWAVVPAVLCVGLVAFGVRDPGVAAPTERAARQSLRASELLQLPASYWAATATGTVYALARFSEAFLVLKAQNSGVALALLPLVYVWMNMVFALVAIPAGVLSDRIGRPKILLTGLATLVIADLAFTFVPGLTGTWLGVGLWGAFLGQTQGLLSALVADTAPPRLRGTAFGLFNLTTGVALLLASLIAGWLWSAYGPDATFLTGAIFAAVATAAMAALTDWRPTARKT